MTQRLKETEFVIFCIENVAKRFLPYGYPGTGREMGLSSR